MSKIAVLDQRIRLEMKIFIALANYHYYLSFPKTLGPHNFNQRLKNQTKPSGCGWIINRPRFQFKHFLH